MNHIEIRLGEIKKIGKGILGVQAMYSGIVNLETFAMSYFTAQTSIQVFYPVDSSTVRYVKSEFRVVSVNKDRIILEQV